MHNGLYDFLFACGLLIFVLVVSIMVGAIVT